jgi:ribosomal protein S18 acetylase RimI-like enzyme
MKNGSSQSGSVLPGVSIRPLTVSDIPAVASWLVATPLWQRYRLTDTTARSGLESGLGRADVLLVSDSGDEDGQACGLAWCMREGAFGRSAYLRLLGVRPGYTGLGIGAALLEQAEQAVATIAREMFLLVSDFNVGAQRFYRRQGYTPIGAIPGYVLPDVTELLYWKRLQQERPD